MIDRVKKHVYIGWLTAFLNSPVLTVSATSTAISATPSHSESFMIDRVKKHVYIGWLTAFLNSPVLAVFVGTGSIALTLPHRRLEQRAGDFRLDLRHGV